ncbi:hypothetical protein R1sor_021635 [Riccia sorocarpa]|uniref:FAS1 domain-containing protein n=1 Tax=Riccia sorocarpa TaxID=122646 RepID=A0ABD3GND2_9MARC
MAPINVGSILLLLFVATASAQTTNTKFNVTTLLDAFPDFTVLNQLLSSTKVADEINSRDSLTLLAVTNDVISAFQNSNANADLSDVLRYHVLLQFLGLDELNTLILFGASTGTGSNASYVANITRVSFDFSILQVDSILVPATFGQGFIPPSPPSPVAPATPASQPAPVAPATPASGPAPTSEPATPASGPAPTSEPATPASGPAPTSEPATPASGPVPASEPATPPPASEKTPVPAPAPASKAPTKPPTKAPASAAAPGPVAAPRISGASAIKGGVVALFASFVAVLFM